MQPYQIDDMFITKEDEHYIVLAVITLEQELIEAPLEFRAYDDYQVRISPQFKSHTEADHWYQEHYMKPIRELESLIDTHEHTMQPCN